MVELAMALGIIAFGLMAILALVPLGLQSNRTSAEETRATAILSNLEADLRNTHPSLNGGRSRLYGLQLPYALDANGQPVLNTAITAPTAALNATTTVGLDDTETPVALSGRPPYQASVIYTRFADTQGRSRLMARLVVSWPGSADTSPAAVTDPKRVQGSVELAVSFPGRYPNAGATPTP